MSKKTKQETSESQEGLPTSKLSAETVTVITTVTTTRTTTTNPNSTPQQEESNDVIKPGGSIPVGI